MRLLSSAAVICAALFSGTILHAQDPELLAKRQCRSVHINQQGHPSQASALYNVVKAKTSVPGTYFCAMNFDDGYIGFQEQSNGKKVIIFSIWDPVAHGDNPNDVPEEERTKLVKLGKDARSGRFGGEGTGGQSFVDYPWAIGENMRFLVCVKKIVNEVSALLDDSTYYDKMSRAVNPYGDGKACQRICDILSY